MVKKIFQRGYVWLILAFMYAPIILLAVYSFNNSQVIGQWSDEWTFGLYEQLQKFANRRQRGRMRNANFLYGEPNFF